MPERTGLVLSGGGAKGAYEIGVYEALENYGITPYIGAIAGASVGALNAVLLETCDNPYQVWRELNSSDLLHVDNEQVNVFKSQITEIKSHISGLINHNKSETETLSGMVKKYLPAYTDLANNGLPFSQDKIAEIIRTKIDFSKIKREIIVVCTRMNLQFPTEAFYLNHYSNELKKQIILASSAYPVVYCGADGIEITGKGRFFDGGFRPRGNTPVSYLPESCRKKIVVHLKNNADISKQPELSESGVINIIPSRSLGSTLYLEPMQVKNNMALGFSDTLAKMDDIEKLIR